MLRRRLACHVAARHRPARIRDAPATQPRAASIPALRRVVAFGLSGFLAGIAGGLYLRFEQSFTTSQMGLTPMTLDVTMLVIGGLGTDRAAHRHGH